MAINQRGSHRASFSLSKLLEWLHNSERFCLQGYKFTIKRHSSGRARCKRCTGQGMGKVSELSEYTTLQNSPYIHQPRSSPNPVLLRFFKESSLQRHNWLNHWLLTVDSTFSLSSLCKVRGCEWEFQSSDHMVVLLATSPQHQALPQSHLINLKSGVVNGICCDSHGTFMALII